MEARIMVVVSVIVTLLYASFVFFTYVSVHSDVNSNGNLAQLTNQSDSPSTTVQSTKEVIEIIIGGKEGSSSITTNNSSSYFYQLCLNYCDGKESVKPYDWNEVVDCVCPN